ncbi:helix-turn-helix domain-containing protein [Novosphingobium mathurense]|nr:helix-turn-helix domain-containing protein [Novosphingobium mathurense]
MCDQTLGRYNKSGYCRKHLGTANAQNPEWREKHRAGVLRKIKYDPEYKAQLAERARRIGSDPSTRAKRSETFRKGRYWELGNAAQEKGSDARKRAGRSIRERRLSWCPPHLREEYMWLMRSQRVPAAEARVMIEEQNELELARWRRSIGYVEEQKPDLADQVMAEIETGEERDPFLRALSAAVIAFSVSVDDIFSEAREVALVRPRQALALVMRRHGKRTTSDIAAHLHRSDHTSAINWLKRGEEIERKDKEFASAVALVADAWNHEVGSMAA